MNYIAEASQKLKETQLHDTPETQFTWQEIGRMFNDVLQENRVKITKETFRTLSTTFLI